MHNKCQLIILARNQKNYYLSLQCFKFTPSYKLINGKITWSTYIFLSHSLCFPITSRYYDLFLLFILIPLTSLFFFLMRILLSHTGNEKKVYMSSTRLCRSVPLPCTTEQNVIHIFWYRMGKIGLHELKDIKHF